MTQVARPTSDVSDDGWTPAPVCVQIGEAIPDDTTLVTSRQGPAASTFEVGLSPLAEPVTGPHVLTVRIAQTDGNAFPVTLELRQGSEVVAWRTVQPTTSFVSYEFTLTDDEVDLITDYTSLRLRVSVGSGSGSGSGSSSGSGPGSGGGGHVGYVQTACCTNPISPVLNLHIGGAAACLNGDYPMYWDANSKWWATDSTIGESCGANGNEIRLTCGSDGTWNIGSVTGVPGCFEGFGGTPTGTCSPLDLTYSAPLDGGVCGTGTMTLTVTEVNSVTSACCGSPMPVVLTGTFSGGSGVNAGLNGVSVEMTWNGAAWVGTLSTACLPGGSSSVSVYCQGAAWESSEFGAFGNNGCGCAPGTGTASGCGVGTTLITFALQNPTTNDPVTLTVTG